jgi:hypothetical protein
MRKFRIALGALAALFSLRDAFVFGGLAAACYGIAQVHAPSAWIAGGTVVLLLGLRR